MNVSGNVWGKIRPVVMFPVWATVMAGYLSYGRLTVRVLPGGMLP